jgi:hypothetical protein
MMFLLPVAAAMTLLALLHILFFRKFSMSVIFALVTGVAMLTASLLALR